MGQVILQVLPAALFLAFSPVIVALVVLFLASEKPLRNSTAFTLPSIIGSMLVGIILIVAFNGQDFTPKSTASNLTYWGQVITAVVFLVIGFFCWWKLPKATDTVKLPKWAQYIETMQPRKALFFGFILFLNNVFFTFTATADVLTSHPPLSVAEGIIVLAVFTLISTVGMWTLIVYKVASPEASGPNILRMRDWLVRNNRIILVLEFGILGVLTLVKGLIGLLD
jgi:hypothetical protein